MPDIGYAVQELRDAVSALSADAGGLQDRLQRAWTEHVQMLWEDRYLPEPLHDRFAEIWRRYTAPSDDRRSTTLRTMDEPELAKAASDLVAFAFDVAAAAARS